MTRSRAGGSVNSQGFSGVRGAPDTQAYALRVSQGVLGGVPLLIATTRGTLLEDLVDEVYVSKASSLIVKGGELLRSLQIVKVRIALVASRLTSNMMVVRW